MSNKKKKPFCRGKKYLELPYTVKGMDVSFSGLLSFIEVRWFGFIMFNLLSTIFQLYRGVSFIGAGNRSTRENHRPTASH
jgi:hypothetical protein